MKTKIVFSLLAGSCIYLFVLLVLVYTGIFFTRAPQHIFVQAAIFLFLYWLSVPLLLRFWKGHSAIVFLYLVWPYPLSLLAHVLMGLFTIGSYIPQDTLASFWFPYFVSGLWLPGIIATLIHWLSGVYSPQRYQS